jgi:hypothetical protein
MGRTQPYYWLATDHNKDKKKTNHQKGKEQLKERRIGKDYEQNKHKASNSGGGQDKQSQHSFKLLSSSISLV